MPVLIVNPLEWSLTFENSIFPSDAGDWIAEGMQLQTGEYSTWHPQQEEAPSDWVNYPAVIIAGSLSSAYDKDAWIMDLSDKIRCWAETGTSLLGICFGHQLIAEALGGKVICNPKGWELGSCEIFLTETGQKDALFEKCPRRFFPLETHQDIVEKLPPEAECLAYNGKCAVQAFRIGDAIRAVQFHPEFNEERVRRILEVYRSDFKQSGIAVEEIKSRIVPFPERLQVLGNFKEKFNPSNLLIQTLFEKTPGNSI